jgi:hypothetical protein
MATAGKFNFDPNDEKKRNGGFVEQESINNCFCFYGGFGWSLCVILGLSCWGCVLPIIELFFVLSDVEGSPHLPFQQLTLLLYI